MEEYIEHKLRLKIEARLSLHDDSFAIWLLSKNYLDELVNKVKLGGLGAYKIIWENDLPNDITIIDPSYQIEVFSGKYYVLNNGQYVMQLYSSEFIEFSLRELRDYRLRKIL